MLYRELHTVQISVHIEEICEIVVSIPCEESQELYKAPQRLPTFTRANETTTSFFYLQLNYMQDAQDVGMTLQRERFSLV